MDKRRRMGESYFHGIALIISNTKFDIQDYDRHGGEKDEPALETLFTKLGYKVVLLKNLKGPEIKRAIQIVTGHEDGKMKTNRDRAIFSALSKDKLLVSSEDNSFVLCLMSHGKENVVLGIDEEEVEIDDIFQIVGPCKDLVQKPKMVFIQACRGDATPTPDSAKAVTHPEDFLFSFATFFGHAAFRDEIYGSWYVKALCSIFESGYKMKDLDSMITEVHNEIDKKREEGRQVPEKRGTLKYKVYFDLKK